MAEPLSPKRARAERRSRQLAERLETHWLRFSSLLTGPVFANAVGKPLALSNAVKWVILPALNRCEFCKRSETNHDKADYAYKRDVTLPELNRCQVCKRTKSDHDKPDHPYKRDSSIPEWRGWHAARRGLGNDLYRLGAPDIVIQRILRSANVNTTASYYIKTAADDVRSVMTLLESRIAESGQGLQDTHGTPYHQQADESTTIQ